MEEPIEKQFERILSLPCSSKPTEKQIQIIRTSISSRFLYCIDREMEEILNKIDKMELSLMSKMQETRSSLIDQLKKINEKIDSQEVAKAEVPSHSDSDQNPLDIYKEINWIGEGASGEVFLVLDEETDEYFAMKRAALDNNSIPPDIAREISLLYDLDHANIIKLKNVYPYKRSLYLLMEHGGKDLHDFLKKAPSGIITTEVIKVSSVIERG